MLTKNDLKRLETYARENDMNYSGMLYRMGMRILNQDNLDLAKIAFECVIDEITSAPRVDAEAHCRLADIAARQGKYIDRICYLDSAMTTFRFIADHHRWNR